MKHFGKKSVIEHLKEARLRGALALAEVHGAEMPGALVAGLDAARETALFLGILYLLTGPTISLLLTFSIGILIWKVGRSALLGWARLERLHRLIEEERWEIEHHRHEEEQELRELYAAKGFSGQLLTDVIATLSADDNRLLKIMLEEEMGLTLEAFEHPLKQSLGAGIGVICAAALYFLGLLGGVWVVLSVIGIVTMTSSWLMARFAKNPPLEFVVWSMALAVFSLGATYLIKGIL